MKDAIKKFNRKILPWIIIGIGLPVLIYGMIFQTLSFTLISVWMCITFILIGLILGFIYIYSMFKLVTDERNIGKHGVGPEMVGTTGGGLIILFLIGWLILYFAPSVIAFYIGIAAVTLAWFGELLYQLWIIIDKKKMMKKSEKN